MDDVRCRPLTRSMRRPTRALLGGVVVGVLAVSCSGDDTAAPPDEFCEAAATFDEEVPTATTEEQIELVTAMVDTAPDEIADEARVFLDALKAVADGDDEVVDDPDVQASVDDVNRFASQECGLLGGSSPFG